MLPQYLFASWYGCDFGDDRHQVLDVSPTVDSRPRCVLLIGNGFSRGLAQHAQVDCCIQHDPLLPQPPHVTYPPLKGSSYSGTPLWSDGPFGNLRALWRRIRKHCESDTDAYNDLLRHDKVTLTEYLNAEDARIPFSLLSTPAVELRRYLWHLISHFEMTVTKQYTSRPLLDSWQWAPLLEALIDRYRVTIMSYNYDSLIEEIVRAFGHKVFLHPECSMFKMLGRVESEVVVLKPHGSVQFFSPSGWENMGPDGGDGSNYHLSSWAKNVPFSHVAAWPPTKTPPIPDLVPPGLSEDHLHNFYTDVRDVCEVAMRDADLLITWGLSARPPDYEEVQHYVSHVPRSADVIQIGLIADRTPACNMAEILHRKRFRSSPRFVAVDSGEDSLTIVGEMLSYIKHAQARSQRAKSAEKEVRRLVGNRLDRHPGLIEEAMRLDNVSKGDN